jgi:hypothetical protein
MGVRITRTAADVTQAESIGTDIKDCMTLAELKCQEVITLLTFFGHRRADSGWRYDKRQSFDCTSHGADLISKLHGRIPQMAIDISAISTALQKLANIPGAAQLLGGHLTTSQEMQAVAILDQMSANSAGAAALLPAFTAIPNIPVAVTNPAVTALGNPAQFATNITQARAVLFSAATSTSALGAALSNRQMARRGQTTDRAELPTLCDSALTTSCRLRSV